jgi:carbon storage regulator CsrA
MIDCAWFFFEREFMLVLTRRKEEEIVIRFGNQAVQIKVTACSSDRVSLGFTAAQGVAINRLEIDQRIQQEAAVTEG